MTKLHRSLIACACLLPLACFGRGDESADTETGETGDGDPGDGDGDPGDGDGDPGDGDGDPGDGDGDPGDSPPQFDSFTVNGSVTPGVVEFASGVLVEASVSDPDMDISYIVFLRDGQMVETYQNPGPDYAYEWVVSGAELNGTYQLSAEVYDSNDNMAASESIEIQLGMPNGGEADMWTHDGGQLDAVYDVTVNNDGTAVVLTGQTTQGQESRQRTDRVVGPVWTDKVEDTSLYGAAATMRDDGGWFVAGAIPKLNNSFDSALYHYDAGGNLVASELFDGGSQLMADDIDNTIALAPAPMGVWVMGAYFASGGPNVDEWNTYVRRYTDGLDIEYTRWPSEALAGRPFAYDMAGTADGGFVLVGGQFAAMPIQPWFGTFDATGMNVSEVEINDFDGGVLNGVDVAADGAIAIGGQATTGGDSRTWVRSYDASGAVAFDVVEPGTALGVVAAVGIDPWGEITAVATENCTLVGFRYEDCDLIIRKYAPDGTSMWSQDYVVDTFLGPALSLLGFDAAIDIDRFGYVYVTAIVYTSDGTDWWARKLHP